MKVLIKDLSVHMEIKNKGIELEIRSPGKGEKQLGELVVNKSNLALQLHF